MKLLIEIPDREIEKEQKELIEAFLWGLLEWKYLGQFTIKFTFEVDK